MPNDDFLHERQVIAYGLIKGIGFIDYSKGETGIGKYLSREIKFSRNASICPQPDDILVKLDMEQNKKDFSEKMRREVSNGMYAVKILIKTTKKEESTKIEKAFNDINIFLSTLRIIKPNLAYPKYKFVFYPDENKYFYRSRSHLSNCFSIEMNMDKKDIWLRKFDVGLTGAVEKIWNNIPRITSKKNRVLLALKLQEAAYLEYANEIRILLFAIALECLFSTERTDLMHNLASRSARFLSDDAIERKRIYHQVILAYNIRSMIVHGLKDSIIRCKYSFAEIIFRECVRCSLRKILAEDNLINVFTNSDKKIYHTFLKNLGLNITHNLIYENDVYWIPITNKLRVGPYCPQCWRKEKLPIKMQLKKVSQKWRCLVCGCYKIIK